jgi:hypothetical protein
MEHIVARGAYAEASYPFSGVTGSQCHLEERNGTSITGSGHHNGQFNAQGDGRGSGMTRQSSGSAVVGSAGTVVAPDFWPLSGSAYVVKGDAEGMADAVAQHGAVVAIINVPPSLQYYHHDPAKDSGGGGGGSSSDGGVYDDPSCCSGAAQEAGYCLAHAVAVVGFGEAEGEGGKPYWVVKNSFSGTWGAGGYVKMARGKDTCGIEANAVVPIAA